MVLVISQAELGDGQPYEALFIGRQTMPLSQQIKSGHGKSQSGLEIGGYPMGDLLEMTHAVSRWSEPICAATARAAARSGLPLVPTAKVLRGRLIARVY